MPDDPPELLLELPLELLLPELLPELLLEEDDPPLELVEMPELPLEPPEPLPENGGGCAKRS